MLVHWSGWWGLLGHDGQEGTQHDLDRQRRTSLAQLPWPPRLPDCLGLEKETEVAYCLTEKLEVETRTWRAQT